MACPISGGAAEATRSGRFLISLMGAGLQTHGTVHAHQLKSLDWAARQAKFIEKVPDAIVQEVLDCLIAVFEDE